MENESSYISLMNEIVSKQMDILGPDIAVKKAVNVAGIKISDDGKVQGVTGDPQEVLQNLVDEYIALSGAIVKNVLGPVLAKYPDIKLDLK